MSQLAAAVCSITATQRGRFFWAVWWSAAPCYSPFRKPDASNGGAASEAEALRAAEKFTGRHLTMIEPYWARAWNRMLRGEAPPPPPRKRAPGEAQQASTAARPRTSWSVLGVEPGSPLSEVKRAFRKRALETHPDQGGDARAFQEVQQAYERIVARLSKERPRRRGG